MHYILKYLVLIFSFCVILLATKAAIINQMEEVKDNAPDDNWWKNAVIYQIYPRSFMDSNGDGIGDLRGIIEKMPHLADIGVTATWISPIFASPMVDFGYDISDFKSIQPDYGTLEDFEELIKEAQRLDIKIILDFVPNHTSDQCIWFEKSANREPGYEDFYVWSDGKISETGEREPPNNWRSVFFGSTWTWHEKRQQYYLHQFTKEQPDLNFRNPKVLEAMDDILIFWMNKGVSGFRIDAINHLFEDENLTDEPLSGKTQDQDSYNYTEHIYTRDLPEVLDVVQHWRSLFDNYSVQHVGPQRIMMVESSTHIKAQMDYYEDVKGVNGAQFPFNFLMIQDINGQSDARDFAFTIKKWLTYMPRGYVANWVMGSHDVPRVATRFGERLTDAMNMLLMTLPGVAVTYNGEEIGMQDHLGISWEETIDPFGRNAGPLRFQEVSRDPVRTPFQWSDETNAGFSTAQSTWLPVHPNYVDLNLAAQKLAAKSHYKVYQALTALRRQLPVLREGSVELFVLNRKVFMLKRELKGQQQQQQPQYEALITIINLGSEVQKVDLTEFCDLCKTLKVLVADSSSTYENGHEIPVDELQLNAQEGLVGMLHA